MRVKHITITSLILLYKYSIHAYTQIVATPQQWLYAAVHYSGYNFIPDLSTASVTGVELGLTSIGAIYQVNIIGDGLTRNPVPDAAGCGDLVSKYTITLASNERITMIEAWGNSDTMWYHLKITTNTDTVKEYNPNHGCCDTRRQFTVLTGYEFTGFYLGSASSGCKVTDLQAIVRTAVCTILIDLSGVNGMSQNIITDVSKTITFTATHMYCGHSPQIEYQLTFPPGQSSATINLIDLPLSRVPDLRFRRSTNTADAKIYTLTVSARPVGTTIWLSPTSATYEYKSNNQCLTATLSFSALPDMTTQISKQTTVGGTPYYESQTAVAFDSVSSLQTPNACGSYQYLISSSPITASQALSTTDLTIDPNTGVIKLYTANLLTRGTHSATVGVKLINYPSIQQTTTFSISIQGDPCLNTLITISSNSVENFIAFAGQTIQTQLKYTFNDTVSEQYTLPTDTSDFCGEKQLVFSLNGTETKYLFGNNSDFIYFSPPSDSIDFGDAQATILA